jgi:hypothetical protein
MKMKTTVLFPTKNLGLYDFVSAYVVTSGSIVLTYLSSLGTTSTLPLAARHAAHQNPVERTVRLCRRNPLLPSNEYSPIMPRVEEISQFPQCARACLSISSQTSVTTYSVTHTMQIFCLSIARPHDLDARMKLRDRVRGAVRLHMDNVDIAFNSHRERAGEHARTWVKWIVMVRFNLSPGLISYIMINSANSILLTGSQTIGPFEHSAEHTRSRLFMFMRIDQRAFSQMGGILD